MKKKIIIFAVAASLCSAALLAGCGEEQTQPNTSTVSSNTVSSSAPKISSASEPTIMEREGDLDEYHVEILDDARIVPDSLGGTDVLIKVKFTNVSDEDAAAFGMNLKFTAFQDGVELKTGFPKADDYESGEQYKEVKKGSSIEIEFPVKLSDEETPVEIEIEPHFSTKKQKVVQTMIFD